MPKEDEELFNAVFDRPLPVNERTFFEHMKEKLEGEYAPSADLILSECDNDEGIFIVRYFFSEFKVGRHNCDEELYEDTLSQIINDDMFRLLGRHITVLDWLRELDFTGINYDGNAILRRNCHGRL